MPEWITANWVWILLALGAGWFLLRRGGAGCGLDGRGHGREREPRAEQLESPHDDQRPVTPAGSLDRPRRHGGCC